MPRRGDEIPFGDILTATGEAAPSVEEKLLFLQELRGSSRELGGKADRFLINQISHQRQGLAEAQEIQEKLKAILKKLTAPPWHPAVFIRPVMTPDGQRVEVVHGNSPRVVGLADEIPLESLAMGDGVFLGNEMNVVVEKSPDGLSQAGETASFERYTEDGRMVLKWRDEVVVVHVAEPLKKVELKNGDLVLWDESVRMAFEKIERAEGKQFLLDEVPDIGKEQVGGQEINLETLLSALTSILVAPDIAMLYGLGEGRQSILLEGPPGCGKTLLARIAAAEIQLLSGKRCSFGLVKPAEWESPWVGETQQNIRSCFKALREAAKDGFAILFLDEIEAVGRIRGRMTGHHSDKFLAALLAELDGFTDRGNVAIITATNRKDLLDPALLERLSDVDIRVRRPDMRGARAIFQIHLSDSYAYSPNGTAARSTRNEIIETAVSRFYSPNADNELCVLQFQDGKTRTIRAHELASGRSFKQICRAAGQSAYLRHIRSGEPGLRVEDIEEAVSQKIEDLSTTLNIYNVHDYLSDLPEKPKVDSVTPIKRKVTRPHRYLNNAA